MLRARPGKADRPTQPPWLLSLLLVTCMAVAILLACTSPCFAGDIRPPTDAEAERFARESVLKETGWDIYEYVKMHRIEETDGQVEVYYYLFVVYTATLPDREDPEKLYDHAAYETGVWKGSASGPAIYQSGYYGAPYEAAETLGEALSALDGVMQEAIEASELEPGWPVVSPGGEVISPGSEGGTSTGGEGSKIPGPGNWWQWLTGTVVAGAAAAGIGLLNTLFGTAPPPPAVAAWPTPPPPPPPAPDPDIPRIRRTQTLSPDRPPTDWEIYGDMYGVYIAKQTLQNMGEDIASIPGALQDAFNSLMDKALWVRGKVKDVESMRETLKELQEMTAEKGRAHVEALQSFVRDPQQAFKELGDRNIAWVKSTTKELKRNPLGLIKGILGVDWWKNAMDHSKPILERLASAAVAGLNAIGIIEGISGLGKWLLGAGEKTVVKALVPKGAGTKAQKLLTYNERKLLTYNERKLLTTTYKEKKLLTYNEKKLITYKKKPITPKAKLSEDDLSKVTKTRAAGEKPFFDKLGKAEKSRLKAVWEKDLIKAESKVKSFKKAMKTGDIESRTKAVLELQKDPLAIQKLNAKDKSVIKSFKRQLGKIQNEAMERTREQIAREMGVSVDQVEVFKATNPSARVRAGSDQDLTVRVVKGGKAVDVPADKLQKIYDQNFYKAAGSPQGTTPAQLGRDCRNVAVDRHSAEAFGMSPDDFDAMQLGKATSHTDTMARTMQHKAEEAFARADQLARSGDVNGALKERWLGQRETVKAFNNQVKGRVDYLDRQASPEKMAAVRQKIANIEGTVKEVEKMIKSGADPVKIDDFLRSRGTTSEELAKQVADVYRRLTP